MRGITLGDLDRASDADDNAHEYAVTIEVVVWDSEIESLANKWEEWSRMPGPKEAKAAKMAALEKIADIRRDVHSIPDLLSVDEKVY